MAGDWIKMRGNLWDDPRVAKLCDLTGQSEAAIIGGLYWLWASADQHTEDGVMPGLTLRQIDRKTGIQGIGDALCQVGWIADHPEGIRIVRFEEHNGASAKKRCQTAKRVANFKKGNAGEPQKEESGNATDVTKTLPERDLEKEKEKEKEVKTKATRFALPDWVPVEPWEAFDEMRKGKSEKAWTEKAKHLAISRLKRFAEEGHDIDEILKRATEGGWSGLYAPKADEKSTPKGGAPPWWSSDASILAKGQELGMQPRAGEDWQQFRGRINERLAQH